MEKRANKLNFRRDIAPVAGIIRVPLERDRLRLRENRLAWHRLSNSCRLHINSCSIKLLQRCCRFPLARKHPNRTVAGVDSLKPQSRKRMLPANRPDTYTFASGVSLMVLLAFWVLSSTSGV